MALINDSRLYSGGSERLNSRPHIQLYAQLMQRQQANREAFDEYIRNLNMKINPAGMRNNEIPVFNDELKKFERMGIEKKEFLRNPRKDNGQATMEFQSQYQKIQNLVARSKGIEGLKKPGVEVITDPNKYRDANKEKLKQGFYDNDQDLYLKDPTTGEWVDNPGWKPFNPAEHIEYRNKPFDQGKFRGLFKDIKRQELEPIVGDTDKKTMTRTITKRAVFDQDAKDQIAQIGVTEYMSDPATKDLIDQLNPNEWNDYFKQHYGRDINPETEKADVAAAYALKSNQEEVITQDIKDDEMAKFRVQEAIRQANRERNMRLSNDYVLSRDSFRRSQSAKVVDEYVERQFNDPKAKKVTVTNEGDKFDGRTVKAPQVLINKYSRNVGTDAAPIWRDPAFIMTEDKKYIIPVYKSGDKTKTGWDAVNSQRIPIADWKIEISNDWIKSNRTAGEVADELDAQEEIDESSSETKIIKTSKPVRENNTEQSTTPAYKKSDLINGGWTEQQIKQAVQAGKIKVN